MTATALGRYLAGEKYTDGSPISRDDAAARLEKDLDATDRQDSLTVQAGEAHVVAELLDELAAVYHDEPLGWLARHVAVRLYDRLGI